MVGHADMCYTPVIRNFAVGSSHPIAVDGLILLQCL